MVDAGSAREGDRAVVKGAKGECRRGKLKEKCDTRGGGRSGSKPVSDVCREVESESGEMKKGKTQKSPGDGRDEAWPTVNHV